MFFLCCFIHISLLDHFPIADFGLKKQIWPEQMMPGLFLKEIATKAVQLKASFFGRLVTGILHKKGWPENPSLFKVRLGKFVEIGTFC